jgi:WD40 repeat protein
MRHLCTRDDDIRGEPRTYRVPYDELNAKTIKIYTHEIPLGHVNYADFIDLVVQRNIRPERPDDEDVPQLSDAVWELAKSCWIKEPKERPTAAALCTTVSHLLETTPITRPTDSAPGLSLETLSIARPTPDVSHARPSTPPPNLIIRGHTEKIWCATFSLDGKRIVSGSEDCTIRVWDAQTGNPVLGPLKMHTHSVISVAFSPDDRRIASGSCDNTILVWHALTGKMVAGPLKGHTRTIRSVCFSPDGKRIASCSSDQTIRIWDAQTGNPLVGPPRHTHWITSVVFSPDGARIASGSPDETIRVWDVMSGRLVLGPLKGHKDWCAFVAFSPDSKRIISSSEFRDVCVWNADTGVLVAGPSLGHAEGALAVVFAPKNSDSAISPDGKWIAALARDNTGIIVHVWDSKTGQIAASLEGHTEGINSITFSADSRRVLTASHDKTIRVHTLDS